MSNALFDIVRVTTVTPGTGAVIALGAAVLGFKSFVAVPDATVVTYFIEDANGGREIGPGTVSSTGTVLTRGTPYASTNAGARINLSGSAQVAIGPAAEDFLDFSANSIAIGTPALIGGVAPSFLQNSILGSSIGRFSANIQGAQLRIGKSRGTPAAAAAVAALDRIGEILFYADDGSTNGDVPVLSAVIRATAIGTVSAGIVAAWFDFQTMTTAGVLGSRMRLFDTGGINFGGVTDPGAGLVSFAGALTSAAGSNLGDQIRPNYVTCTAQLDRTSNITLATATGLSVALAAGKTYTIEGWLSTTCGAVGGLRVQLVGSGGLTATSARFNALAFNGTTLVANTTITALATNLVNNAAIITDVYIKGSIVVNVAGTINVQMAQTASNATASSVFAGSTFQAVRTN